jgi:DHA2 family metal-tetracycline-proton antiporter-like MFS transporter
MPENEISLGFEQKLIILTIALSAFLGSLDVTIVNISLPAISHHFNSSLSVISWVIMLYLLILGSLMMAFGRLGDIIGFRRIFLIGLAVFTLGSILCGLAPRVELLILFRGFQAAGEAMCASVGPAMISSMLPDEVRGRAFGYVATFSSVGVIAGPVVGGALTAHLGWRWIFFVNVPVGIFALLVGLAVIPELRGSRRHLSFDLAGATLLFAAIFALLYSFNQGREMGWGSFSILGSAALSFLCCAAFVRWERCCKDPLVDLRLFRSLPLVYAFSASLLFSLAFSGAFFLLPFYLELVKNVRSDISGVILVTSSVAVMIVAPIAGKISDRAGGRMVCLLGALISMLAFVLFRGLSGSSSFVFLLLALSILGIGMGMFLPVNRSVVMSLSPPGMRGLTSSMAGTFASFGQVIGVAAFETILSETISSPELTGIGAFHELVAAETLTQAFHNAFFLGILVSIAVVILSLMVQERSIEP